MLTFIIAMLVVKISAELALRYCRTHPQIFHGHRTSH
jgi:hypothetical protein